MTADDFLVLRVQAFYYHFEPLVAAGPTSDGTWWTLTDRTYSPGATYRYQVNFNGKLRDELLDREIFYNLWEAKVLVGNWRKEYNHVRPHSSLGYRPSAPEAIQPPAMEVAV